MNDKFYTNLSDHSFIKKIRDKKIGLEKESLRVNSEGVISFKKHPYSFGSPLTNKFITTDYSEALLEMVTPTFSTNEEVIDFLNNIHSFVCKNLKEEILWSNSMPCVINGNLGIPIAYYGESNIGRMKTTYRRGLGHRYGRIMQVIAGIHYNYSFGQSFWNEFKDFKQKKEAIKIFKSQSYFKILRNILRNNFIITYLFGSSPAICKSYLDGKKHELEKYDHSTMYKKFATSLRLGDIGYQNRKENDLGVDINFNSITQYVKSIENAITTRSDEYRKNGVYDEGYFKQLNDFQLQIENEYYGLVRPKNNEITQLNSIYELENKGVEYIEMRAFDLNPFSPSGISVDQMNFLEIFILYSLLSSTDLISEDDYKQINYNSIKIAHDGRDPECKVFYQGKEKNLKEVLIVIFKELESLANIMDLNLNTKNYIKAINMQKEKIYDISATPSHQIIEEMKKNEFGFFELSLMQSEKNTKFFNDFDENTKIREQLSNEAIDSLKRQKNIEANDSLDYYSYIKNQFKIK